MEGGGGGGGGGGGLDSPFQCKIPYFSGYKTPPPPHFQSNKNLDPFYAKIS